MSTRANYFKIGVFVIASIFILMAGLIALKAGVLKGDTLMLETYIDESVLGLSAGSQVLQRGVQIGFVKEITFVTREYKDKLEYGTEMYEKYSKYIMVIMEVDRKHFPDMDDDAIRELIRQWVENGLRLKLSYLGITGIAFVEADYVESGRYPPPDLAWSPKNLYIPSAPSTLTSFTLAIDSFFQRFSKVNFEELSNSFDVALDSISNVIKEANVSTLREELTGLIADMRKSNNMIASILDESKGDESAANIPETIRQLNITLKRMDDFITSQQSDFEAIMANIRRAAENLRELSENAKDYPRQVLFGAPPAESEVTK